jgi:hypothetical protein
MVETVRLAAVMQAVLVVLVARVLVVVLVVLVVLRRTERKIMERQGLPHQVEMVVVEPVVEPVEMNVQLTMVA